jgi:hypothetical protein
MGKTGSTALARALADATGGRVFQVFRLDGAQLAAAEQRYRARARDKRGGSRFPGAYHLWEAEYLSARLPTAAAPWNVVTTVREPVAQAVSAFFHGRGRQPDADLASAAALVDDLVAENWIRRPLRWFEREFAPALGIDVYDCAFDAGVGHAVVETPAVRVLLLRQENLDAAPYALGSFLRLGRPVPVPHRNEAASTPYAATYRDFVAHAALPPSLLDTAYGSRYAQHFYTPSEIRRYRERWSSSGQ